MPFRWLIDTDQDEAGLRVIVDLHGGNPDDEVAHAEFQEIKEKIMAEVIVLVIIPCSCPVQLLLQRELGEGRSYATMWRKYKRRVLLAMSSQAFAQLVCRKFSTQYCWLTSLLPARMESTVRRRASALLLSEQTSFDSNLLLCA